MITGAGDANDGRRRYAQGADGIPDGEGLDRDGGAVRMGVSGVAELRRWLGMEGKRWKRGENRKEKKKKKKKKENNNKKKKKKGENNNRKKKRRTDFNHSRYTFLRCLVQRILSSPSSPEYGGR